MLLVCGVSGVSSAVAVKWWDGAAASKENDQQKEQAEDSALLCNRHHGGLDGPGARDCLPGDPGRGGGGHVLHGASVVPASTNPQMG